MIEEKEPYPVKPGELWDAKTEAWYARFDYVNARVEKYLDNFRESVDYEFTKITPRVEQAQKNLTDCMEKYASGAKDATIHHIKAFAVILKDAFKRPEQKRSELAQAKEHFQARETPQENNYVPGTFYSNRMAKVKDDYISNFIREHNKRLFFAGQAPPPGVTSCMVEGGGGFDASGLPLSQYEAEKRIDAEVWEVLSSLYGEPKLLRKDKPTKKDVPEPPPVEPELSKIDTTGKTVEEVKAEAQAVFQAKIDAKRRKRIKD